jgi:hypothetical protein
VSVSKGLEKTALSSAAKRCGAVMASLVKTKRDEDSRKRKKK